jgi:hypothetical protein
MGLLRAKEHRPRNDGNYGIPPGGGEKQFLRIVSNQLPMDKIF